LFLWLSRFSAKFNKTERAIALVLIAAIVVSCVQLLGARAKNLATAPADGGVHIEGVIGSPRFINPVLAGTNQIDLDITRLVYSGLVKISPTREIVPDLAASWSMTDGGKSYIFNLRDGVTWHDGKPFTADDVVYTFNVLQNNDYTGVLKANFAGITVERLDNLVVKFTLPAPSSFFLYNLSLGIIPEHVFREIPVKDLTTFYKPTTVIGTGPFGYENGVANDSVSLQRNKHYYGQVPHLDKVVFYFYDNERTLQNAFKNRTIGAAGFIDVPTIVDDIPGEQKYVYQLPQYRAVFFNQLGDNPALKNQAVRQALAYGVNKEEIISSVEHGNANRVDSPILSGFWGNNPNLKTYDFDIAKAVKVLQDAGWKDIDGDGFMEKDNVRLSFKLSTRKDAKLSAIADLLIRNWKAMGAEVILEPTETANFIKDVVRTRNYDALLFGQDLGGNSDPYVYWHSSQIQDPGLALAVMADKDIDKYLEAARLAPNMNQAITPYLNFQNVYAELMPAVLLYAPRYTYIVDTKLKGATDKINLSSISDRFANIEQWYIKTKKVEKPTS
jgi:peptide/nickel transport system substrate-binding protein